MPGSDRFGELHRLLRGVTRQAFHLARDMMHDEGLPRHSMPVMRMILHRPGATVSELSRETGMAKSYISKALDTLAAAGIIEKRKDPADQRILRIHPTAAATAHVQETHAAVEARLSAVIATLPSEKVDTLIDGLCALQAALDKAVAETGTPSGVPDRHPLPAANTDKPEATAP